MSIFFIMNMDGGFMNKGKLIVIEGSCDGVGKSTQLNLLKDRFEKNGYNIVSHHFPTYGEDSGNLVENYLKGEYGNPKEISPYFVNSLYAIDRAIVWKNKLQKAINNGDIIILDRYMTSSLIYQSAFITDLEEKKKFIDYVTDYEFNKLGIGIPDSIIFLQVPFETSLKLRDNRQDNDGIKNDIHERDLEFLKKVYENSLFVANYLNWDIIECTEDYEMRSIEDIHEEIYKLVRK